MRRIARAVAVQALALCSGLLVGLLALLVACGPTVGPPKQHFVAVVENTTSSAEDMTLRWALGGVYVGTTSRTIQPMSSVVVVMGEAAPDLLEISSTSLNTAWGPPDFSGGPVMHIVLLTGVTWSGAF